MKIHTDFRQNEQGMASFMVVFALMIIISLVTLGFAQVIRTEQRQALDRNLNARAFYAAESGINSAANALKNGYIGSKTNCGPDASGLLDSSAYVLDGAAGTELNCLTIDDTPTSLEYPTVPKNKSLVVPINAQGNMNRLAFSWQNTAAVDGTLYSTCVAPNYAAPNYFTPQEPQGSWNCPAPVLRIDLIDVTGSLDRNSMVNNQFSVFLYPTTAGSVPLVNYAPGSRFSMVNARCTATNTPSTPNDCNVVFNMPGGGRQYYARIVTYYADARLTILPTNGGNSVELAGAQAIIDSTGKSLDVVRRLQVRKPLTSNGMVPSFGLESAAGLCKRYQVMAGNGTPGSSVLNVQSGGTLSDGSPCALN